MLKHFWGVFCNYFYNYYDCSKHFRNVNVSIYADVYIYDGQIWQEFLTPEGIPFLYFSGNFAFQLNVDWFPF